MIEETHYYPFGLTMDGISFKAAGSLINKKGYNGNELQNKEFSDGSGLELYDFIARTYDEQIGRFIQIDPVSEEADQESWNTYHFGYNNPIRYNDPDGKFPIETIWDVGNIIWDAGKAVVKHIQGDHKAARASWVDAGADLAATFIPYVPAGATKLFKGVDKALDAGEAVDKVTDAAKSLPQLKGKSIPKIEKSLNKKGFDNGKDNGKNQTFKHNDGSEVRVHKYGNEKKTEHKSANNAHVHKQDSNGNQLNDRGVTSTDPNATHIGVKNPKDLPQVRNRPHGSGN